MSDDRDDDSPGPGAGARSGKDAERLAHQHERETERLEKEAERLAHAEEREAERREKDAERLAHEEEREAERLEKEAERLADEEQREAERLEKDAERWAHEEQREAERLAKEAERLARDEQRAAVRFQREAERLESERQREAERRERERQREADRRGRGRMERGGDDADSSQDGTHDGAYGWNHDGEHDDDANPRGNTGGDSDDVVTRWARQHDKQWKHFERAWRRHAEQRERWETRRKAHRARWKKHRRWRDLHEEREMWMRTGKDKRAWGPWWLQARMRRRIFSWLALAFAAGAVVMWKFPEPRWYHGLIALVVLSVMSGGIAFRLTRPLLMIVRVARDIGDGKLDTRLDVHAHGGETRLLAVAINEMAERIEQQVKDQRQLLAAVSHELRTPLGHMRVLIDTARDCQDRKALAELEREVLVLDDLVGRLLASSRLEFGNLDCRALDLGELVSDVATSAGIAPEAIEAIGDVRATVDPTLIRRAVANLIDNARVHGGGATAVRIERRARQVAIEVDDAGPGVPADRRADAFRAFVPSRAGGLGLGLALVSRIAVAHGGGAWIMDRPGGGARVGFSVELAPRAASEPGSEHAATAPV